LKTWFFQAGLPGQERGPAAMTAISCNESAIDMLPNDRKAESMFCKCLCKYIGMLTKSNASVSCFYGIKNASNEVKLSSKRWRQQAQACKQWYVA